MTASALATLRDQARRLGGNMADYDALLEQVGDRSVVLLGEATHGTREFYRMRAEITRRLIEEKGFEAVAVEADWPDALRLNRYVHGEGDADIEAAFADFQRFPEWMWKNQEVRAFIDWLRTYNAARPGSAQASFHGLDLYSLYRSAEAVVNYLQSVDPAQAEIARQGYACLDHHGDPQQYGYEVAFGVRPSCHDGVVAQLMALLKNAGHYLSNDGHTALDEQFFAEQNAHVVVDAEAYYRAMFGSRVNTWNLRDEHMVSTLFALRDHLRQQGGTGKVVVWAHNSHLGDARATAMGWQQHEHNVGQLVRQRVGAQEALLVGFTTYTGHVSAARDWGGPVEHRWVRPALEESYEALFYHSGLDRFFMPLEGEQAAPLRDIMLERAIGVLYRPETERPSHYFRASLARQFDAVFHLDETTAVEPLETGPHWQQPEVPDTYPFGV